MRKFIRSIELISERKPMLAGYHTESMMNIDRRSKKKCTYLYTGPLITTFYFDDTRLWDAIDSYDSQNKNNYDYDEEYDDYDEEESIADSLRYDYDLENKNEYFLSSGNGIWYEMIDSLKEVSEIKDYLPKNLKSIVNKIELYSVSGDNLYRIIIKTNYELTKKELNQLKDYIDGQMSDGFGEGFEQIGFDDVEYVDRLEEEIPITVNVSLWSPDRDESSTLVEM